GTSSSATDLDSDAYGDPPNARADVLRRIRKLALDVIAPLTEVRPPLVVDRDDGARAHQTAELDCVLRRHGGPDRPRDREAAAAEMQERRVHLQAGGDFPHAVVEHGVARNPQYAVLLTIPPECEADHVADDRPAQGWAVAAGRGGDFDGRPVRRFEPRGRPGAHPPSVAAQALGTRGGGDDDARRAKQRASGWVEVVVVVV